MRLNKLICFIVVISLLVAVTTYFLYQIFIENLNIPLNESYVLLVKKGSNSAQIKKQLQRRQIISSPMSFHLWARLAGYDRSLKAGEYQLSSKLTIYSLLHKIQQGEVIQHHIRFQEGTTFSQMRKLLAKRKNIQKKITNLSASLIMKEMNSSYQSPEGMFFPDTYKYPANTSDLSILKKSYNKMQKILQNQWQNRQEKLPYKDKYQALIMASLIESEAAVDNERSLIASVLINRLNKNMRLQVDPTVMYGLNIPFGQPITKKDLKEMTPYNTYRNHGLPPTPIGMPSLNSIHAALHPAISNYLFYVAKDNGTHQFSVTYKEHRQAIAKYLRPTTSKQNKASN